MNDESLGLWRRFLRIGTDHPLACLVFLLAVSVAAVVGLGRLTLNTGFDRLGARDGAERQAYLQVAREFGSDNRSFVYLRDEHLWTPAKLQALLQLHQELRALPFVERIDDVFTSPAVRSTDGQLNSQPLLPDAPADELGADDARATVLADPIARRNLVSADGKSLAIGLAIREGAEGRDGVGIHDAIERVLARARERLPGLEQVGQPRVEAAMRQGVVRDFAMLAPAAVLVLALVVLALGRKPMAAALALLVGSISLLWTFGAMGYLGVPLGLLFILLPPLVIGIGASEIVRLASGLDAAAGDDKDGGELAHRLGGPAVLTAFAVALGFAANAFTGIEALRDFGFAAAAAILANGLVTILLLPLIRRAVAAHGERRLPLLLRGLSTLVVQAMRLLQSRIALAALVLATSGFVAAVLLAPSLRVSHDPLAFFRTDSAVAQAAQRMQQELAGAKVFYITLDANTEGAFRDPANLQRLAEIQAFIAKQRVFDRSLSLADVVAQANREAGGGRESAFQVPPTRKLVGQYLLLHRPHDLVPYVSHDFRRANIVVRHNVRESSILNHHVGELRQVVAHLAGPTMTTAIAGEGLLINAASERMVKGQVALTALLLAFVLLVMALMFTSLRGGLVALAPAMVPLAVVLGVMRGLEMPVTMATAVLAVVAVGATIQATSHLLSRYSELCRNATDYEAAVLEAVRREAVPMLANGLALSAAFAVLTLSDFALIAEFGAMASAAMLLSIIATVVVTPLLMSRLRLVGLYEILAMSMPREALERSPLFHGLTSYQIRKTILISELREYREGECLVEQGTVGRSMYLVVSGRIEVVRRDDGAEQRLALLEPGEVFGEIGFVHETYRTATVRALGAVSVLCFDHDRLKKDLALFPHIMAKLNFNISGILGKRLAEIVEAHEGR